MSHAVLFLDTVEFGTLKLLSFLSLSVVYPLYIKHYLKCIIWEIYVKPHSDHFQCWKNI